MMQKLSDELIKKAKKVKLFLLDVDGTLTDGKIIVHSDGSESKNFNVRDGMGIAIAITKGYKFAVVSGRYSKVVEHRTSELKFHEVHQAVQNKLKVFHQILENLGLKPEETAYIGDDINDLPVMNEAGFSSAPKDADETVLAKVDFVSRFAGGDGAVRELIELVLTAKRDWELD